MRHRLNRARGGVREARRHARRQRLRYSRQGGATVAAGCTAAAATRRRTGGNPRPYLSHCAW